MSPWVRLGQPDAPDIQVRRRIEERSKTAKVLDLLKR
jgi:hypothetical protein